MPPIATVDLRTRRGLTGATLEIWSLRKAAAPESATTGSEVQEGSEYRFVLRTPAGGVVAAIGPEELFSVDPEPVRDGPLRGRLRTGNSVGAVEVVVDTEDGKALTGWLDIRSTKLDFDAQYRWMLSGVAEDGVELLLRSFAPSQLVLQPDYGANPQALYQQVAFLGAVLQRPHTVEAVERVLRNPYVTYVDTAVELPVGRGVPGSSGAVRALVRPGRRVPARAGLVVDIVPERLRSGRPEATIDNLPNRYVRFVLDHWATVLDGVLGVLGTETPADRRGRRQITQLLDLVDGWRYDPRFADVGRLQAAPLGNQVIHRRPGYREIRQAFMESQAAAMLTWDGGDEVHRAGQQDVAQLYEYWCYLELRRLVEACCDHFDSTSLVELADGGMHLRLRRGRHRVVHGFLQRDGRQVDVELWFNRSFSKNGESWTMQMRPDCSIRLDAQTTDGTFTTWVHFDAKYRVDSPSELFVDDDAPYPAKRADLLKMHAYRDAIRSSAGSYVLYPGDQTKSMRQHREILPGLGAFSFVPGSNGHATHESAEPVLQFLDEVMDHVAEQATNRERAEWWEQRAHAAPLVERRAAFLPLSQPPADTSVLVGYCFSSEHLAWIEATGLYNLRLGDRRGAVDMTGAHASAETLVLWMTDVRQLWAWHLDQEIEVLDAGEMRALGYPRPPTGRYLCRTLGGPIALPTEIDRSAIDHVMTGHATGAPITTSWATLLESEDL